MTIPIWRRWTDRPQSLPVRKFLFQIHLWMGIAASLYVAVISLSGSAIVLRREIERPAKKNLKVTSSGRTPLTIEQIQQRAQRAHPDHSQWILKHGAGIIARKALGSGERNSPAVEKFWKCAKEAASAK